MDMGSDSTDSILEGVPLPVPSETEIRVAMAAIEGALLMIDDLHDPAKGGVPPFFRAEYPDTFIDSVSGLKTARLKFAVGDDEELDPDDFNMNLSSFLEKHKALFYHPDLHTTEVMAYQIFDPIAGKVVGVSELLKRHGL